MSIVNAISVSFTYALILMGLTGQRSIKKFLELFTTSLAIYLSFLLLGLESFLLLPMALAASVVNKDKQKGYLVSLFQSLSAMSIFILFVVIKGSLFFVLLPYVMQHPGFDLFMSVSSIVFGVATHTKFIKKGTLNRFYGHSSVIKKCAVAGFILVCFISVIYPLALLTDNSDFIFSSHYSLLSISVIFAIYLVYSLITAESKIKHEEQRQKYEEINNRVIESKYNDIISLKHYYNKLYDSLGGFIVAQDWQGLEECFEKHITPLHKEHIEKGFMIPKLDLIESPLIKNLLLDSLVKAKYIHNAEILIDISDYINIDCMKELDLFIVINEWIDNAFAAIENKDGYIQVSISKAEGTLTVQVSNPIYVDIDISVIHKVGHTTKQGHNGIGLSEVSKIINSYENIECMTYVELGKFNQLLIARDK